MKIEISNNLILSDIPDGLCLDILDRLTIANPAYADAVKMKRWTGHLQKELAFYREENGGLTVPRGFLGQILAMAKLAGEAVEIEDRRRTLPELDFNFVGRLRPFQQEAADAMLRHVDGTLSAPTGSGKTVIALQIIAARRQPALVIVHNKELLNQWLDRIETFLQIPKPEIGVIGAGKKNFGKKITVGIVNSIYPHASLIKNHIGFLIVDECHRAPSRTFTEAVTAFDSKFMLGLSATPYRRDGLTKLIFWHLGDRRHQVDSNALQESGDIVRADVVLRYTPFRSKSDAATEYSKMLSELTTDSARNALVAADVAQEAANGGGACLVLTDRREHALALQAMIARRGINVDVLTGEVSTVEREAVVRRLNSGAIPVVVATGQLIGEGFDCKTLSTLFMATPVSFEGRVIQYLGRVLRPAPGKNKARIFDYVDGHIGVLSASARKRRRLYIGNGWSLGKETEHDF